MTAATSTLAAALSARPSLPISFPPTQEGYASKIRWYSFQFVLDELVEEIEEAYLCVTCVLNQLPYPIR